MKVRWRTEPTIVAILGEDLCLGVKGQTNLELAGFLRNLLRQSPFLISYGVEHFMGVGGVKLYHFQENSEYVRQKKETGFGRKGAEPRGKEPRLQSKVLNLFLSVKGIMCAKPTEGWAQRQPSGKGKRNCSLAQPHLTKNVTSLKEETEDINNLVGERCVCRRRSFLKIDHRLHK